MYETFHAHILNVSSYTFLDFNSTVMSECELSLPYAYEFFYCLESKNLFLFGW